MNLDQVRGWYPLPVIPCQTATANPGLASPQPAKVMHPRNWVPQTNYKITLACSSLLALLAFSAGCSLCKDEAITEARSPDNLRTAAVFYRNCGATTSEYGHVVVRPTSKTSSEVEHTVFTARYEHAIGIAWKSPSELVVTCRTCRSEQIMFQVSKVGALKISYELMGDDIQ
jgi:hypothetical protein